MILKTAYIVTESKRYLQGLENSKMRDYYSHTVYKILRQVILSEFYLFIQGVTIGRFTILTFPFKNLLQN